MGMVLILASFDEKTLWAPVQLPILDAIGIYNLYYRRQADAILRHSGTDSDTSNRGEATAAMK